MGESSTLGLIFEIAADPSKAIAATESFQSQAGAALKQFEDQIFQTMTKSLGITKEFAVGMAVGTGAVVALGVAMFELADHAAEVGAKIFETSEKTGIAADKLSGLMALTKETGESFDSLSTALARAGVNLEKAIVNPGAQSSKILAEVMGSAKNLSELGLKPMDERLQEVLKRIFEMNDVGQRNLALQTLLGRGWQTNIEALKLLAEQGYGPAIEAAKRFGIFFDPPAAAQAKAFRVEWEQSKLTFESVAMVLGQKLVPIMSQDLSVILAMIQYLPQLGTLLWQVATQQYGAAGKTIKAWKSFDETLTAIDSHVQSLVNNAADLKGVGGELGINDKAEEERQKKITALLVKASIDRTKTMEDIDKKATEQQERRSDEEWKRILARDEIGIKARAEMAKTEESSDKTQTDRSVKRNDEAWTKITAREAIVLQARIQMAKTWEDLDKKQTDEAVRINNARWKEQTASALKSYETIANSALSTFEQISGAMKSNHAVEIAMIIARGAIKSAEQVAEGLASLAYGNVLAAGMHFAAAGAFAGLAGYNAATSGSSGGGGGGAGGGQASAGGATGGPAGQGGPVRMAPGAGSGSPSGTVHVIVSGSDAQVAAHVTKLIDNGVKYQGLQLTSSHSLRPAKAGG